jgi:hypothetical protein
MAYTDTLNPQKCYLCARSKVLPMIPVAQGPRRGGHGESHWEVIPTGDAA